jgi:hypothetical protein
MQVNTVSVGSYNFVVTNENRPYSNDFVLQIAKVVQYDGQDEVYAIVKCTANSKEPGMLYFCTFSTKGELIACNN